MKAFCGGKGKMGDPRLGEVKWTESFLDLASWCHPHQDELNTPEFIIPDEFSYGNVSERQVIENTLETVSPQVDMQCDQWGTSDPLFINYSPFEEENSISATSNNNNNNVEPMVEMPNTMCLSYSQGKRLMNPTSSLVLPQPSPIRMNGNLLLSQYSYEAPQEAQETKYSVFNTDNNVIISDAFEKLNSSSMPLLSSSKPHPLPPIIPDEVTVVQVNPGTSSSYLQSKDLEGSFVNSQNVAGQSFKVPPPSGESEFKKKERPKLEPLNIESANNNKLTTSLDTPEVLKPLNDATQFSLLEYVNGDSEEIFVAEEVSSPLLVRSPSVKEETIRPDPEVIQSDHDYTEPHFLDLPSGIKDEPQSPPEAKPFDDHPPSYTHSRRPKKRKSVSSDDYIYDTENITDDSMEWAPSTSKKRAKASKRRNSKTSGRGGVGVVAESIGARRRRSSLARVSIDFDSESITSTGDRYRELRDRNNEASRRSRLNRKQKEMEMNEQADALCRKNISLKAKAVKLENLVGIMRKLVMAKVSALGKG